MANAVTVTTTTKSIFASKTFWANILAAVASYSGYFPPNIAVYVVPLVNILLRFVTVQPVTLP
jgi:hypothetical protein